jgi:hypothetical protein
MLHCAVCACSLSVRTEGLAYSQLTLMLSVLTLHIYALFYTMYINVLQRLCLLRALRPDMVVPGVMAFVAAEVSYRY